MIENYLHYIH